MYKLLCLTCFLFCCSDQEWLKETLEPQTGRSDLLILQPLRKINFRSPGKAAGSRYGDQVTAEVTKFQHSESL